MIIILFISYNKNELCKTACGSPCYAAPEMILGNRYDPLMIDIWSSGVVFFAMICGYLPFEEKVISFILRIYFIFLNNFYNYLNIL